MSALKPLAELLHTLFCNIPHSENMEELLLARSEERCYYYLEKSVVDSDDHHDTDKWIGEARALCEQLETSPEEALRIMYELLEVYKQLRRIFDRYPNARTLASALLQL